MNDWSRNRKRIILAIVLSAVIILVGVPFFFLLYDRPSCSDGRQNGDEAGIDCGGSCQKLCSAESLPILLKGDPRVLFLAESATSSRAYEVVALLENPNQDAEIYRAKYTIKVYDAVSAIPVKLIEGSAFVPKGAEFALFEGPFNLEASIAPARATLEWEAETLSWQKNLSPEPEIEVSDTKLLNASTTPRLEATVGNLSLNTVSNLDFVALISDAEGNLFAASKTFIDTLTPGARDSIVFTWPRAFAKPAAQIRIIKRVFPDRSFIR